MNIRTRLGFGGVATYEARAARIVGRVFSVGRMILAFGIAVQWNLETKGQLSAGLSYLGNWITWSYFVLEILILALLVKQKLRFLYQNCLYLAIAIMFTPALFHISVVDEFYSRFRFVLVILLLIPWLDACRAALSDNRLGTTIASAFVIILFAGVLMSGIDPSIPTPWDGIWWAVVTVSTVGYGDVVPDGVGGKIFASFLILIGLALFAVLTANFSAIFVRRGVGEKISKEYKEIKAVMMEMQSIKIDEQRILAILNDINQRLDRLERDPHHPGA